MSYILDALQRADAERERGHVPGLNSQIVPPPNRKAKPVGRRGLARTAVAGAVVAALLIAAGLWWWRGQADGTPVAPPAPASAVPPPAMPPVAAVTEAPAAPSRATPTPEPVQPILAPPRVEPAPKRPQASHPPAPAPAAAPAAASPPANAPAAAATPAPAATAKAPPAAPAAASTQDANATPVRSFAELSPEARAQLPAVNVSGSTYSKNPALRMLIVNGKVLQEGQEIAPGFKLETIGQRSAVLNHNGLRYSIGY